MMLASPLACIEGQATDAALMSDSMLATEPKQGGGMTGAERSSHAWRAGRHLCLPGSPASLTSNSKVHLLRVAVLPEISGELEHRHRRGLRDFAEDGHDWDSGGEGGAAAAEGGGGGGGGRAKVLHWRADTPRDAGSGFTFSPLLGVPASPEWQEWERSAANRKTGSPGVVPQSANHSTFAKAHKLHVYFDKSIYERISLSLSIFLIVYIERIWILFFNEVDNLLDLYVLNLH